MFILFQVVDISPDSDINHNNEFFLCSDFFEVLTLFHHHYLFKEQICISEEKKTHFMTDASF